MKKILTILAAAAAIFGAASCSTGTMHDAEVMLVEKVVVEGLTDLVGQEMVISGNWILGKDGTSNWVHGLGDTTKVADGAIGTVGADGSVEFKINQLTSEATLEFVGKVNEDGWVSSKCFGEKAYENKLNSNAKVPNAFTGSATPKTILGRVNGDDTITWSIVDAIAENKMAISEVIVVGLPAATYPDGTVIEFKGFFNADTVAALNGTVSEGKVTLSFPKPVVLAEANPTFKLKPADNHDWSNSIGMTLRLGGPDNDAATFQNTCTGVSEISKIVGQVQDDNSVTWSVDFSKVDHIVGWEIVGGAASSGYLINGSTFGWSFPWDGTSAAKITTNADGDGSLTFATPYTFSASDEYTGCILDGNGPGWGIDRLRPDGSNIKFSQMNGYSAAKLQDSVADNYVIRLTRTAVNNWTWSIVTQ